MFYLVLGNTEVCINVSSILVCDLTAAKIAIKLKTVSNKTE